MPLSQIRANQITNVPKSAKLVSLLKEDTTAVTWSNLATENTLYNFKMPGNLIGIHDTIYYNFYFSLSNQSGGTITYTARFYYGGTSLLSAAVALPNDSSTYSMWVYGYMKNTGVTNSQKAIAQIQATSNNNGVFSAGSGTAAIDSTLTQTISLTIQASAATATQVITQQIAILHYLSNV